VKKGKTMKLYLILATEHNGEQEYSHEVLAWACCSEEALQYAREYFAKWYEDAEDDRGDYMCDAADPDHFEFNMGALSIDIQSVTETTEKAYKQRVFDNALI
jgi:hypothetical protein